MKSAITFRDSEGTELSGILSDVTKEKIIVLCHGFTSSKEGSTYIALERELNQKGISTFRFDFFGHGESGGLFEELTVTKAILNANAAIDFVKELGFKSIGLQGSSFGGLVGLNIAAERDDLVCIALKAPVSDYIGKLIAKLTQNNVDEWKERGYIIDKRKGKSYRLNYSFYESALEHSGFEAAKSIKIPVLIVHGTDDEAVPIEQSKKTKAIINDCRLKIIKEADHNFTDKKLFDEMIRKLVSFMDKIMNNN